MRPGYSPDEEFTVMAVRGIAEHGLPILPSGLLYDRGILYSYASWLAHAITGSELPAYRALSLISAAIALWLVVKLVTRIQNQLTGIIAAGLVATSIPFWATATSGRFYAPFLALYLASLISMRGVRHPALAGLLRAALFAFLARSTHELAFTLAAVPVIAWIIDREHRSEWLRGTIGVVAGLVLGQMLLFALHWVTPTSGETMVRRFFLWQVLNLFERPGDRQFTIPIVVMVIAWLAAPRRARTISVIALSIAAMILTFSIARATNTAPLSMALIGSVLEEGSRYPLDMFWHIARATPLTLLLAIGLMLVRMGGAGGEWRPVDRALHGLWIGWVLWFGVIESGITTNYLLVPVSLMLMAIAVDGCAILIRDDVPARRYFSAPGRPAYAAMAGLALMIAIDQWRGKSLDEARPTINVAGIDEIRNNLQPNDRVVCTDELGCLMLVGRIDRWLALDDYVRQRFIVQRGDRSTGVYTGVPALSHVSELFDRNPDGSLPTRVVVVDIFKEYPIGNSRSWLPRAITAEGVEATSLLETPQARVLEINMPALAARQKMQPQITQIAQIRAVPRGPAVGRPHVSSEVPEK